MCGSSLILAPDDVGEVEDREAVLASRVYLVMYEHAYLGQQSALSPNSFPVIRLCVYKISGTCDSAVFVYDVRTKF